MNRVALDVRPTRQLSVGMKLYNRELTQRLPHVAPDLNFVIFQEGGNFNYEEQVVLPRKIRQSGAKLTHFFSQYTPLLPPTPYVMTIHDLIHLRYPEFFKAKVGPYYATVVRFVAKRAARILTDDVKTVADIERFLRVSPAKCRVIPLGIEQRYLQPIESYRAAQPYFLYVGNHREHKNLRTLFEAWSALPSGLNVDLYLTGPQDFGNALHAYQAPNRQIVVLGDVPAEKLPALYAGAIALVHPALCEGFGFPMLEAMAAGTAVIASQSALPAVLEPAALAFEATDIDGLRARMERVLADEGLRTALVNEGRTLARTLSWDECARRTASVYREVLEECA